MAVVTRRIQVNDHIRVSTFYALDSDHDVICLDVKSQSEGGLGHLSTHVQLTRLAASQLITALTDSLDGKADKAYDNANGPESGTPMVVSEVERLPLQPIEEYMQARGIVDEDE